METFATAEQLATLVEEQGFTGISQRPLTFGVCTLTCGIKPSAAH